MTIVDMYQSVVGDQGKAYFEVMKWGVLYARQSWHVGKQTVRRRKACKRLNEWAPNQRLHISGAHYVH